MSRNAMHSFDLAPHETMHRSVFDLSHSLKTSFNAADIVPILNKEVLPGDTWSVRTTKVVRLQTLLAPILDDLYLDIYYFFIPHRLVWDHFKQFMGESDTAPWIQSTTYTVPQITSPASTGWNTGSLADYMGIRPGIPGLSVSALPFRAYALTMNSWFINENTTYPCDMLRDDTTTAGTNGTDQVQDPIKGGCCFKAAKYKDLFTSCLPSPQRGQSVTLPLGQLAPVYSLSAPHSMLPVSGSLGSMHVVDNNLDPYTDSRNLYINDSSRIVADAPSTSFTSSKSVFIDNLYADMAMVTGTSINQLRMAFQLQKYAETSARAGNRYIEMVRAFFGTETSDARFQRPEYLGGNRVALSKISVSQSSASSTTGTPQGHQTAYSVTVDSHGDFSKSFEEHGTLLGLACVRYKHSYSQGIERSWFRKNFVDFYVPTLANIGEQAILNESLFATGTATDKQVFGYNEAWAEYRHSQNRITGEMRSDAPTSLDSWHLGDDYSTTPALSSAWIQEDKTNVDRVLAVQSSVANQLFGDFHFDIKCTRVMPVFSIPGLIDHH